MSVSRVGSSASRWTIEAWLVTGIVVLGAISVPIGAWQVVAAEIERIRSQHPAFDQTLRYSPCLQKQLRCGQQLPIPCNHRYDSDIFCDEALP